MGKVYVGVDPGKGGGIAIIDTDTDGGLMLSVKSMSGDLDDTYDWLNGHIYPYSKPVCYMEKVGGYQPGSTGRTDVGSRMFEFGRWYGIVEGWMVSLSIPVTLVTPQQWQRGVGMKRIKGESDTRWKNRLKEKAKRVFPDYAGSITKAVADAVLITAYARSKHGG